MAILLQMVKLSILIPVYNEARTVQEIIRRVQKVKLSNIQKELIVVDDCSTDGTRQILSKLPNILLYCHKKNMGKGAAMRTAISHANGDIMIFQDADLEYDPRDYPEIVKPILEGTANVVFGSRFLRSTVKPTLSMVYLHYWGNTFLNIFTSFLFKTRITDMETGYKAFRKEVLEGIHLNSNGFEFEPEITAKIIKKGHKVIEVPISYAGRTFSEGKKIKPFKDGMKAIYYLLKYRFTD